MAKLSAHFQSNPEELQNYSSYSGERKKESTIHNQLWTEWGVQVFELELAAGGTKTKQKTKTTRKQNLNTRHFCVCDKIGKFLYLQWFCKWKLGFGVPGWMHAVKGLNFLEPKLGLPCGVFLPGFFLLIKKFPGTSNNAFVYVFGILQRQFWTEMSYIDTD